MKDYRITVKVRNNRILKAIEDVGGTPGKKWCDECGLCYSSINDLINLTVSPITGDGNLTRQASLLCDVVAACQDDLWSHEQLYPLEKNFSDMEMDHEQILSMLPNGGHSYLPDFSEFENEQVAGLLNKAMEGLSDKESYVLVMRYQHNKTLEECANDLGLTRERIRQIETHALRRLRSPVRIAIYADALDISDEERRAYKQIAKERKVTMRARSTDRQVRWGK